MGLLTEYGSQEYDGGVGVREGSDGLRRGLLSGLNCEEFSVDWTW